MDFPRPTYDERIANMTERALTPAALAALTPRGRIIALATSIEGVGADAAPDGHTNFWFDMVCPELASFRSQRLYQNPPDWEKKSSCGLVVRSLARRAGYRRVCLGLDAYGERHPYEDQMALANVLEWGGTSHPRRPGKGYVLAGTEPPPPGCIAYMGEGGTDHVEAVVGIEDGYVLSIAGGQTCPEDGSKQCVLRRRRRVVVEGARLALVDATGRRKVLQGWIDPDLLDAPDAAPTYDFV